MLSARAASAFAASVVLGVLAIAAVLWAGPSPAPATGSLPPGVDGTNVWVGGEVERFDAANGTLYVDASERKAEPLPVNVTDASAPYRCAPSDGGEGVTCEGRSTWGFVAPGTPVCANLVLVADGAPEAGKAFFNATCGPSIEPAA